MPSIRNLLTERKYPFLLTLALFLLSILLLFVFSNPTNRLFSSDFPSLKDLQTSSHPLPPPPPRSSRIPGPAPLPDENANPIETVEDDGSDEVFEFRWDICRRGKGFDLVDYIPCLDNIRAIKELKSRRHMEHRERHCPKPSPRCLVPLPQGYKVPVPWPKSRDMVRLILWWVQGYTPLGISSKFGEPDPKDSHIWYNNVPHPKLVEYKKDQNWVQTSGDYLVFPGGGTQFKQGVTSYIEFIEQILPIIEWGRRTRVILDVGCGVASFGGYLLDKNAITMSFAPKDEHEAQIQFALERGIPAFLSVIGTKRLAFPDSVFDLIHCARCRVHWDADDGKPLLELNRILRPGGFFVWSATPVYRDNTRDQTIWNAMVLLTDSICWKMVVKSIDATGIGVVIYQKPVSNSCYERRKVNKPPLCVQKDGLNISWYSPLDSCLPPLPNMSGKEYSWPISWPERLKTGISSVPQELNRKYTEEKYDDDMKHWETLVSEAYLHDLGISWSGIHNVMDMNAGFGGFAAAFINQPLWVMNVVPVHGPDTLPIIFNRGLIGIYHDWCEAFNTYPRTYDLLHSSFLFGNLTQRCNIIEVVAEMDRILRPGKWVLIQDTVEMIRKMRPILRSLHYETALYNPQFLVGKKDFWRPDNKGSTS